MPDTLPWSAGTSPPNRPAPAPPCPADYEILGELGRGGMGVVYKARHRKLDRVVALKMILSSDGATERELSRFRVEARAVAALRHPGIVQIFEVGEHDGRPFFSLEFVDGGSLGGKLRGTPWPSRRAAELVEQLARAVQHAHEHGIIHRDLKPANVLLTKAGEPKVTDFGLAKKLDDDSLQTRAGSILGTPSYMAPEQAEGRVGAVGPAADVYGLGAVLYELLTGRPPFQGATVFDTLEQVRTREPVPPGRLAGRLPRDVETVCLKCLEKDPRRRYASAGELADDLRRFRDGRPVAARPTPAWERAWRWARRRPGVAAAVALTALVVVASFAGVWLQYHSAERDRARAAAAGKNARELNEQAGASRAEAETNLRLAGEQRRAEAEALEQTRRTLYGAAVSTAARALADNESGRAAEHLDACPPEFRGWEWYHLKHRLHSRQPTLLAERLSAVSLDGTTLATIEPRRDVQYAADSPVVVVRELERGRRLVRLDTGLGTVQGLALGADGKRLVAVGTDSANGRVLAVFPLPQGPRTTFTSRGADWAAPAVSPDSRLAALCAAGDDGVRVFDLASGAEVLSLKGHEGAVLCVAFAPDGKTLASGGADGTVRIWDAKTGAALHTLTGHRDAVRALAFAAGGATLCSGSDDHSARVWDPRTGAQTQVLQNPDLARVRAVALSRDGATAAAGGAGSTVLVWDVRTAEELVRYPGADQTVWGLAFLPGERLLSVGDARARVWDKNERPGSRTLAGAAARPECVAFSPDGGRLVAGGLDRAVRAWEPATGRLLWTSAEHAGAVTAVAHGRHGVAASGGADGTVRLWDAATGKARGSQAGPPGAVLGLAFAADGRLVSAGADGVVRLRDGGTGAERSAFTAHGGGVTALALAPDGRLATAGPPAPGARTAEVRLWSAAGRRLAELGALPGAVRGLAFGPGGRTLAAACDGPHGGAFLWEAESGRALVTFRDQINGAADVAFSPDGRRLFVAGFDGRLRVWDARTFQAIAALPVARPSFRLALAVSPDSATVAVTGEGRTVQLLESWTGPVARVLRTSPDPPALALAPDGRYVAVLAVHGSEGFASVWDVAARRPVVNVRDALAGTAVLACGPDKKLAGCDVRGRLLLAAPGPDAVLRRVGGDEAPLNTLSFSADGRLLAVGGRDGSLTVREAVGGRRLLSWKGHERTVEQVALSADGRLLASAAFEGGARVWDAAAGKPLRVLPGHSNRVTALTFLADGRLVTGEVDGAVKVWDPVTGRELRTLSHTDVVVSVAGRPASGSSPALLAAGAVDGSVRLWDLETGRELHVLTGHDGWPTALAFDPEGRLNVACRTGNVWTWEFTPERPPAPGRPEE